MVSLALFSIAFLAGNAVLLWMIIERGCFREYWEAAFQYNAQYSTRRPAIMHLYAIGVGMLKLSRFGGSLLIGAAAAAAVAARPSWGRVGDRFAMLALALFAMEVAGSAVSGMAYEHYYIMWLLPVVVLAGLFIERCSVAIGARPLAVSSFCGACAILLVGSLFDSAREIGEAVTKFQDRRANVVQYVRERTTASDRVYVWNGFADLMFRLGKRPASRYFFGASLATTTDVRSYRAQAVAALRDVERSRPAFILEDHVGPGPGIFEEIPGALKEPVRDFWDSDEVTEVKNRLRGTYELAYSDRSGVNVYELRPVRGSGPTGTVK